MNNAGVNGQTAEQIDRLLKQDAVLWIDAARFVLITAGYEKDDIEDRAAFDYIEQRRYLPPGTPPEAPVRLDVLANMLAGVFEIRGSLFYVVFKSPYFAFHMLQGKRILDADDDPYAQVSGKYFLYILGECSGIKKPPSFRVKTENKFKIRAGNQNGVKL